ncbi:MAG: hypothetical protein ACI943_002499, partial [Gammaproteobacteria bacterium]
MLTETQKTTVSPDQNSKPLPTPSNPKRIPFV